MTDTNPTPVPVRREQPDEVMLFADEFGLLVRGPSDKAAAALDRLLDGTDPGVGARFPLSATDGAAVAASVGAATAMSGEYLRLTAESAAKVSQFGEQLDGAGALRGWVKDGSLFAGQLTFDKVAVGPEQALALQSAAVSLALRSAIANVEAAVQRVEEKVDEVNKRLDSRLRGDVVGTYRNLEHVVARTNHRGRLLQADWDGVASLGNQLFRDLETLRAHVTRSAEALADRPLPKREDAISRFASRRGDVGDMLQLILIAQQSLHLWEYLRVQQVAAREPEHLTTAIEDAKESLRLQQDRDAALVEVLRNAIQQARVIEPLEYRHLFAKRALTRGVAAFDDVVRDFAVDIRMPELADLDELAQPTFRDARLEVGRRVGDVGETARALGSAARTSGADLAGRGRKRVVAALRRDRPEDEVKDVPGDGDAIRGTTDTDRS